MVRVYLSSAVANAANGKKEIDLDFQGDVKGLLEQLGDRLGSGFSSRVLDNGRPRRYINVYVNGKDIRFLDDVCTKVDSSTTVDLIPAVSGG